MTDQERIEKLRQALIAARYEIVFWSARPYASRHAERRLEKNLAKYDAVIEATAQPN